MKKIEFSGLNTTTQLYRLSRALKIKPANFTNFLSAALPRKMAEGGMRVIQNFLCKLLGSTYIFSYNVQYSYARKSNQENPANKKSYTPDFSAKEGEKRLRKYQRRVLFDHEMHIFIFFKKNCSLQNTPMKTTENNHQFIQIMLAGEREINPPPKNLPNCLCRNINHSPPHPAYSTYLYLLKESENQEISSLCF